MMKTCTRHINIFKIFNVLNFLVFSKLRAVKRRRKLCDIALYLYPVALCKFLVFSINVLVTFLVLCQYFPGIFPVQGLRSSCVNNSRRLIRLHGIMSRAEQCLLMYELYPQNNKNFLQFKISSYKQNIYQLHLFVFNH